MESDKKRFGIAKTLLVILSIALLGLLGWYILRPKKNTNTTYETACSTTTQTNGNESFQPPDGWNWYDINDAAVRYAYPASWQSPTDQTNSGVEKYATSYTLGSSGTETTVTLSPSCSDFQPNLSAINDGTFDTSEYTSTKAIKQDQSSYSSISHWSSDAGNQYKLTTYKIVNVGSIKSVIAEYSVIAGSEVCPEDSLAGSDKPKCITQANSDEVDKVIDSLQKTQP